MNKRFIQKGFTLIELIVVIAVLAILAGVAVPKFIDATGRAKESAEAADVGTIRSGVSNFAVEAALGPSKTQAGSLAYPADLTFDDAGKLAFTNVLEKNAQADLYERGWRKTGNTYTGPNGGTYTYTAGTGNKTGSFLKN